MDKKQETLSRSTLGAMLAAVTVALVVVLTVEMGTVLRVALGGGLALVLVLLVARLGTRVRRQG